MIKYPVYQPEITSLEKKYVNECLDSSWISSKGKFVDQFEIKFSEFTKSQYAVSVSNGTVALHLALLALGISEGDEVIVPSLTYIASVNAIKYCGANPVFTDSKIEDFQINVDRIESLITDKTKAIMVVHLYGVPSNIERIISIARKYNLYVIEDCAEALGSYVNNEHVGKNSDIATYSFYGNKTITTGEGGMVTTNNYETFERLTRLRGQGLAKYREYWHDIIGYNFRMTNICAAIGCAQLERIDKILIEKSKIEKYYKSELVNLGFYFPLIPKENISSNWMVTALIPEKWNRDNFRNYLNSKGIETRPMFYPVHTMPPYADLYRKLPGCESFYFRGVNFPSYPTLSDSDLKYIIDIIKGYGRE